MGPEIVQNRGPNPLKNGFGCDFISRTIFGRSWWSLSRSDDTQNDDPGGEYEGTKGGSNNVTRLSSPISWGRRICTNVCAHVCMYACMYVFMYVCVSGRAYVVLRACAFLCFCVCVRHCALVCMCACLCACACACACV